MLYNLTSWVQGLTQSSRSRNVIKGYTAVDWFQSISDSRLHTQSYSMYSNTGAYRIAPVSPF